MAVIYTAVLVAGIGFSAVAGALGLPVIAECLSQAQNRLRAKGRLSGDTPNADGFIKVLLRNGVFVLRPLSKTLLKLTYIDTKFCGYVKALSTKGLFAENRALLELIIAASIILFTVVFLLSGAILIAFLSVVFALIIINAKAQKLLAKWEERLIEQIPDALRALGICFSAGFSLQQAFEQVANDTERPLGSELKQASYDIAAGKSVDEALSALEQRTNAEDLSFAIIALEIQHRTGGSLQDLLENAADAVVSSADLRRQLAVQTTQARMSAKVVTMLPLVLVAVLSIAMDGYLETFFSSFEGLMILFAAIAMEVVGILAIRKILGINLG
jgi:tight adherence protein B